MDLDSVRQTVLEATETGEILTVIYHGGSEPGASRMISPIRLEGDIVMARCLKTNKVKGFSLNKIELSVSDEPTYTGLHQREEAPPEPESLEAGMQPYLPELSALGWIIGTRKNELGLFECFKSGKQKKNPTLFIGFNEESKLKKWHITGLSFKYFVKAVEAFMDEARKQAPNAKNT